MTICPLTFSSQESSLLFNIGSSPVSSVDGGSHQEQVLVEIFP
jgi:hypothetical protein